MKGYLGIASLGLALILLTGTVAAGAANQYTASYLLEEYYEARSELLDLLNYLNLSLNTGGSVNGTEVTRNFTLGLCVNITGRVQEMVNASDQYASLAEEAMVSGDYRRASTLALRALNIIGRAYVHLTTCLDISNALDVRVTVNGSNGSVNAAGMNLVPPGLMSALLRHEIRLSRLKAVIKTAEESGVNVSDLWELAEKVEMMLNESKELLLRGDLRGVTEKMAEANRLMSQIVVALKTASSEAIIKKKGHGRSWKEEKNIPPVETPGKDKGTERHGRGGPPEDMPPDDVPTPPDERERGPPDHDRGKGGHHGP